MGGYGGYGGGYGGYGGGYGGGGYGMGVSLGIEERRTGCSV